MERIGILYEHPEWFKPLFAELERRGIPYEPLDAGRIVFDPAATVPSHALLVNRMSPSAHLRGRAHAIFATLHYLAHLKELGAPTINGYDAFAVEISKVAQLGILRRLGLRHPRARVINDPALALEAAEGLTFPVLIKPNIGGSGAGIRRFDTTEQLEAALHEGSLSLGIDHTALVQEWLPAEGEHIVRVEVLGGEFLYAIRVYPKPGGFNLCPADICQEPSSLGAEDLCPADAVPALRLRVEACRPPERVIREVLSIARAAHLDVGGIEYLVSARDGEVYYYDINALSNFVSDAPGIVGFDPFVRLADFLLSRAGVPALRVL
jgi:hypothetical protein